MTFQNRTDLTEIEKGEGWCYDLIREDIPSKLLDKHVF